jgi:regulator of PEP synthase PpsR (kinase-PPPase family)
MQQIPSEDREALREKMQGLDPAQRKDMMNQISSIDTTNMSIEEMSSPLLDLFTNTDEEESSNSTDSLLDMYA